MCKEQNRIVFRGRGQDVERLCLLIYYPWEIKFIHSFIRSFVHSLNLLFHHHHLLLLDDNVDTPIMEELTL